MGSGAMHLMRESVCTRSIVNKLTNKGGTTGSSSFRIGGAFFYVYIYIIRITKG